MEQSVSVLKFAEARASEISSLMQEVSCKVNKNAIQRLPHHMRRRAASQDPKRVPRKLRVQVVQKPKQVSKGKKVHKVKMKDLQAEYAGRSRPDAKWLETHIWHAKRFKMKTLWGYQIPIHCNDKKLGSSHRSVAHHTMIQDISYFCCIELSGSQKNILVKLSVLTDPCSGPTFAAEMFIDGSLEGHTMLYHPNKFPFSAICPVSFMWRPVPKDLATYLNVVPDDTIRKLWIWCHPSCHEEVVNVFVSVFDLKMKKDDGKDTSDNELKFACGVNHKKNKNKLNKEKFYCSDNVTMTVLKDTLTRHRLMGPKSLSVLTRALQVADIDTETDCSDGIAQPCTKKIKLENVDSDIEKEEIPYTKCWWGDYYTCMKKITSHEKTREIFNCFKDMKSFVPPKTVIGLTVRDPRMNLSWRRKDGNEQGSFAYLHAPTFDAEIADSPLWDRNMRNRVTASKLSESFIHSHRAKHVIAPSLGNIENRLPVIIINQCGSNVNGFGSGWDIIAPLGWSVELWRSYERSGGRPAGLRDLHFINLESGNLTFPCSFPDTLSGFEYEERTRLDCLIHFCKRPPSKRPNLKSLGVTCPYFICWDTLVKEWERGFNSNTLELAKDIPKISQNATNYQSCETRTSSSETAKVSQNTKLSFSNNRYFFVLRNSQLRIICNRINKVFKKRIYKEDYDFVSSFLSNQNEFSKSLLPIRVNCHNRGCITVHSGIYLLEDSDFVALQQNLPFHGVSEPIHKTSKSKFKIKFVHKTGQLNNATRPKVETLISDMSRKLIGYISEGGYASISGRSCGMGHCSTVGFLEMLRICCEAGMSAVVLIKEQNSFQYRVASIEIVDS